MEKINTPLMRIIHEKKKQVKSLEDQVEKLHQMRYVADRILECRNKIDMINNDIQFLESYLPTERDVIEKFYEKGKHYRSHISFNDQFTQTFKSYEET